MDRPAAATTKDDVKKAYQEQQLQQLCAKSLHSQYFKMIERCELDRELSFGWLRSSRVRPTMEGLVVAIQDQSLATANNRGIWSDGPVDTSCRLCRVDQETIPHIISACSALAPTKYVERHNRIVKYIHWLMCKDMKSPGVAAHYPRHNLVRFVDTPTAKLYWEFTC